MYKFELLALYLSIFNDEYFLLLYNYISKPVSVLYTPLNDK